MKFMKRKIAFVSDSVYPFNTGGKEKRLHDISTRLSAQGYDVTIYCMQWWNGPDTIVRDGVTLRAISPYYPLYTGERRSIAEAVMFALHCFKLIWEDFDVIEVDHIPHPVLFTMKLVCLLKGKEMIVTWHEVWGEQYWSTYLGMAGTLAYWIEKVSVWLPNTIISVSEHTTRALNNILGRQKGVITIANGVDVAAVLESTPSYRTSDIVFSGRLLSHKNVDALIQAIPLLKKTRPDISLTIIGEGPEKQKLQTLVQDLDLSENISFLDFFEEHSDVYAAMKSSQVFVLPSTREGFGIVVLEANACGLPVVTIDHPENAARDLIYDGENGVLTTLDKQDLAFAIQKSFEMKRMQDDYLKYVEKYDWDRLITGLVAAYNT
jgi:glycosyltransferase involved in cell wall biosynthesis